MIKTHALDTSALIQAPYAVSRFEENYIVPPMVVLEELDDLKRAEGEQGANAGTSTCILEQLRMRRDLLKEVMLEDGGTLRVEESYVDVGLLPDPPEEKVNNRIFKVYRGLTKQQDTGRPEQEKSPWVIPVTKDVLLRIKAQIIGTRAEDFIAEQVSDRNEQYTGRCEVFIPEEGVKEFKREGVLMDKAHTSDESGGHGCPQLWKN